MTRQSFSPLCSTMFTAFLTVTLSAMSSASAAELLVTNRLATGQVLRFDANSGMPMDTGEAAGPGVFIGPTVPGGNGGLNNPMDLRLGADGNVYVVSQGTNSV